MAETREGIAADPDRDLVWIANEQTGADKTRPSIERHLDSDGRRTRSTAATRIR